MSFKTGEYQFDRPMTMKEVIEKLYEGLVVLHKITIEEGHFIWCNNPPPSTQTKI